MPGVPGRGGPVPKRSDQRRRRNLPEPGAETAHAAAAAVAEPPEPDECWHPVAARWYRSLEGSGQAVFYEPSDWATAYLLAEAMSRELSPQPVGVDTESGEPILAAVPVKGASLSAWLRGMTSLMVTEGDRRRARVELDRAGAADADEDAAVSKLDEYRRRLLASS